MSSEKTSSVLISVEHTQTPWEETRSIYLRSAEPATSYNIGLGSNLSTKENCVLFLWSQKMGQHIYYSQEHTMTPTKTNKLKGDLQYLMESNFSNKSECDSSVPFLSRSNNFDTHTHTRHFCCMPVARMFAIRRLDSWFHGEAVVGIMRFNGWKGRIGRRYDYKRKTCASWWLQPTGFCLCQIGSISQVEVGINNKHLWNHYLV